MGRRIIPARAGFTLASTRPGQPAPDHPRSRGVYPTCRPPLPWEAGSSPLARGLPLPAMGPSCQPRDHPRSRGVYRGRRCPGRPAAGSSPLARGLPADERGAQPYEGIIPARAGFTGRLGGALPQDEDHPRSRGVYRAAPRAAIGATGSSPLARGLLAAAQVERGVVGIIPARAGFTFRFRVSFCSYVDHPRSRGVYPRRHCHDHHHHGSSPLARGLLTPAVAPPRRPRIIPARAGFTGCPGRRLNPREDHPRSRGVYRPSGSPTRRPAGSSPLARGLRP